MRMACCTALLAGVMSLAIPSQQAEAKCYLVTATGYGLGKDMASDVARQYLRGSLSRKRLRARGRMTVKCSGDAPFNQCKATQKACN